MEQRRRRGRHQLASQEERDAEVVRYSQCPLSKVSKVSNIIIGLVTESINKEKIIVRGIESSIHGVFKLIS